MTRKPRRPKGAPSLDLEVLLERLALSAAQVQTTTAADVANQTLESFRRDVCGRDAGAGGELTPLTDLHGHAFAAAWRARLQGHIKKVAGVVEAFLAEKEAVELAADARGMLSVLSARWDQDVALGEDADKSAEGLLKAWEIHAEMASQKVDRDLQHLSGGLYISPAHVALIPDGSSEELGMAGLGTLRERFTGLCRMLGVYGWAYTGTVTRQVGSESEVSIVLLLETDAAHGGLDEAWLLPLGPGAPSPVLGSPPRELGDWTPAGPTAQFQMRGILAAARFATSMSSPTGRMTDEQPALMPFPMRAPAKEWVH